MTDFSEDPFDDRYDNGSNDKGFTLLRLGGVELNNVTRCVVEDLIPRDALVLVWGPPKCGKSFWAFDLGAHVALGRDYCGRQVEQGTVVYIAAEGEQGIKTRSVAFRQERMAAGDNPPFYLLMARLDLIVDGDRLIAELNRQLGEDGCSVIVLDTLNRTFFGSESKDEDMAAYVQAADRLRRAFHCTVIIIHHCGVNDSRPRGHTSLTGAIDAQLAVKREGDKTVIVTVELMKDGPEGDVLACRLVPVDVGVDPYGKPLSSCVVEHLEAPSGERAPKPRKMPASQTIALRMLTEAVIKAGEKPPANDHIPAAVDCVREDLWRRYCYAGGIAESEEQDSKRKAFKRAAEALIAEGQIGKWGDWVWPT